MSANFSTPLMGASILVAEDESLIAMDFVDALRDAGASIVGPAASLAEAYRLASASIDLACLDVDLRGEKIFPFADMLRERGIPFVFASGYDQHDMPARFRQTPYLTKPLNLEHLVEVLNTL